ncbi:hypothetical protein STMU103694_04220 [Streptococcus mutans]|mgnify:CR=1 FL=1|nr:plasmid replication family protein [Streptococcus mutans]
MRTGKVLEATEEKIESYNKLGIQIERRPEHIETKEVDIDAIINQAIISSESVTAHFCAFFPSFSPKNYLDILEDMHIPFVLSPWHDKDIKMLIKRLASSRKLTSTVLSTLIPLKATPKFLN